MNAIVGGGHGHAPSFARFLPVAERQLLAGSGPLQARR